MCGIAGLYFPNHQDKLKTEIKRMTDALTHRGPDDEGFYIGNSVALGHRRLSIIDLATGHQPIFNEDKNKCIVFNGEIFNFKELKAELEDRGHRFSTLSDTETILHAYEEWGEECVQRFRGMFAFCIWDSRNESLFIARDRFGIKPLFYAYYDGKFVFSSEIKSILSDPGLRRTIDSEALAAYFMFSYIPAPLTIYSQIKKMLPGHTLVFKKGQIVTKQYWDLSFKADREKKEEEFIAEFLDLLKESVRLRLISDVPLGAFLSGGIDSSAVVALMSGQLSSPVNTFTIGFGGDTDGFDDERKYARLMAERYRTKHREYEVSPDINEELVNRLVTSFDEPFADDGMIPSYFVSKMARENVTVALSGLGGDEAFGGYERYLGFQMSHYYNKMPFLIRKQLFQRVVEKIPEGSLGGAKVNHLKRFVRSSALVEGERYLGFISKISEKYQHSFFSEGQDFRETFEPSKKRFLSHFESDQADDTLNKVFYCDIKTYLPDDILACTDRMSMQHGLEVRVPFLDHKLMEYCATIPPEMKIKWFRKKYLLKKAVSPLLPPTVLQHKKQGFVGPMAKWLQNELKGLTLEKLSDKNLKKHGLLNTDTVQTVLKEHYNGTETNDTLIWSLLIFQSWFDLYID
jgi:asparagine synthase (glutamine-hydrolysing)